MKKKKKEKSAAKNKLIWEHLKLSPLGDKLRITRMNLLVQKLNQQNYI